MKETGWHQHLVFGDEDVHVRLFEDATAEQLTAEITRRLTKKTTEDDFYLAAGRAAVRGLPFFSCKWPRSQLISARSGRQSTVRS